MSAADRAAAALMASLLEQGWVIHLLAMALCAGATVGLLLASNWSIALVSTAVLLAGTGETWVALRVGFDARCFRNIAEGGDGFDLNGFDLALGRLGLLPPAKRKAGRPMDPRLAGAKRLLILQGTCLVAQVVLMLVTLLVITRSV